MNRMTAWLKKQSAERPVRVFFALTYLFAWLLWLAAGLIGDADRTFFRHLCTFAAFAPAFAAVLTLLLRAGLAGEAQPRLRWDVLLGGWLVTGILYFVALPYASATPVEASIPGWIMRGLMWLGPAWVAAWATQRVAGDAPPAAARRRGLHRAGLVRAGRAGAARAHPGGEPAGPGGWAVGAGRRDPRGVVAGGAHGGADLRVPAVVRRRVERGTGLARIRPAPAAKALFPVGRHAHPGGADRIVVCCPCT